MHHSANNKIADEMAGADISGTPVSQFGTRTEILTCIQMVGCMENPIYIDRNSDLNQSSPHLKKPFNMQVYNGVVRRFTPLFW
jgi:hypothetical protein